MCLQKAKSLLLILLSVLLTCGATAQVFPVKEGSPNINRQIYTGQFKLGLGVPLVSDTAHGLGANPDSLGWVIQVKSTGVWYKRDTVPTGGHFWNPISAGSGSPGTWGSITGTLSAQTDLWAALQALQPLLGYTPIKPADTATMLAAYLRLAQAQNLFYPLSLNPAGYLTSNGLPAVVNALQVINAGGVVSWSGGLYSARPAAGSPQRLYVATDSAKIYYDNGSTWLAVGGSGGGGGGGTISWGAITGTLSSQTDLGNALALNLKIAQNLADLNNPTTARSNLGLANVQNVDQTNASNITSGTLATARLDTTNGVASKAQAQKKADSLGALIKLKQNDMQVITITSLGAIADSSTDAAPAIQAAIAQIAAGSKKGTIYIGPGVFKIASTIHIAANLQITIFGAGGSAGAIENSVSKLVFNSATADAIVDSGDNAVFRDFDLQNNAATPTGGAGIHMLGRFGRVINGSIIGFYNNVLLDNCLYAYLHNVSMVDAVNADLYVQNVTNADFGDLTVSDCNFFSGLSPNPHATTAAVLQPNSGGIKITNCKWNSGSTKMVDCIKGVFSGSANSTSDLMASNNSMENFTGRAFNIASPGANFFNLAITGGNIASYNNGQAISLNAATGGLKRISISGVSITNVDTAIAAYGVDQLTISGNNIDSPSTVTIGVVTTGSTNVWYDRKTVVNYNGVLFLGSGAYASKPAASAGPGLYYATDSAKLAFSTGSAWSFITDQAGRIFHLYLKRKGQPGDSTMMTATDSTLWVAAMRDSLGFHHVFNPDGSVTMWSANIGGGDDTANLKHRIDTIAADLIVVADSVDSILKKTDKHLYFVNDHCSSCDTMMYAINDTALHMKAFKLTSSDGTVTITDQSVQTALIYNLQVSGTGSVPPLTATQIPYGNVNNAFHSTNQLTYDSTNNIYCINCASSANTGTIKLGGSAGSGLYTSSGGSSVFQGYNATLEANGSTGVAYMRNNGVNYFGINTVGNWILSGSAAIANQVPMSGGPTSPMGWYTLGTSAAANIPASGNASTSQVVMGNDTRLLAAILSVGTFGTTPTANGATVSTNQLILQPADGSHPGLITSGTQTLGGTKTWNADQIHMTHDLYYTDATPSTGGFVGMGVPGASNGANLNLGIYSGSVWAVKAEVEQDGVFMLNDYGKGFMTTVGTPTYLAAYDAAGELMEYPLSGSGGNPFADNAALVKNSSDGTKTATFSAANISTGTNRTFTLQNLAGTLALLDQNQTYAGTHTFTSASITVPTQTQGNNSAFAASTAYVDALYRTIQANASSQTQRGRLNFGPQFTVADNSGNNSTDITIGSISQTVVSGLTTALGQLAPLASPVFTGAPQGPTATFGTNSTQLATTAYADNGYYTTVQANGTDIAKEKKLNFGAEFTSVDDAANNRSDITVLSIDYSKITQLAAATYLPTGTIVQNITSVTMDSCHYIKMGNQCLVYGYALITPTSGSQVQLGISLPFASNITANRDITGGGQTLFSTNSGSVIVTNDNTNKRANLAFSPSLSGTQYTVFFSFMYEIK